MRIRNYFVFIFVVSSLVLKAQDSKVIDSLATKAVDSSVVKKEEAKSLWSHKNKASLDISEVAFVNWNSGGSNSISGLLGLEFERKFQRDHMIWENSARVRFGVNQQQDQEMRKTDDLIELNSTFGFRTDTISNWYYSANFNFKTQFTNGYNYSKSDSEPISRFMAPAYLFLGIGTVFGEHIEEVSVYISPLTMKATFVLDQTLADAGAFGVTKAVYDIDGNRISKGDKIRNELGFLVTGNYKKQVMKNIALDTFLSLYTDYVNDFGNVDIDWRLNLDFTVNSFVRATLGSHLKYDNDVKVVNDNSESEETKFLAQKCNGNSC